MAIRFVVCREKQTAGRYRTANFTGTLLTRARNGNNEFAVFLGNEVFCGAGGAAVCVFFLDFNDQLFGWFECQANFAARGRIHWRGRFFHIVRREINKLDTRDFLSGFG